MILSDISIEREAVYGKLIEPFNRDQLQPASYDLRLGEILVGDFVCFQHWLEPKEFILASTNEYVNIPANLTGRIEGKSSLARNGIIIHTAGFIDPGFNGNLTLEITNLSDKAFNLYEGMLIAQISFTKLDQPALRPYGHPDIGSHYQGQQGVTKAK